MLTVAQDIYYPVATLPAIVRPGGGARLVAAPRPLANAAAQPASVVIAIEARTLPEDLAYAPAAVLSTSDGARVRPMRRQLEWYS
jgi:hypothetical protein